jgi:hypothetical protein
MCPDIVFEERTTSMVSQAEFLSNRQNKARLIKMLMSCFKATGANVRQAPDDADYLIVSIYST